MKISSRKVLTLAIIICLTIIFASLNVSAINTNQTGYHDGFFYSFWNQGGGSVEMTLGAAGNYSVTWQNCSNFTCGKGWKPGSAKVINFSGNFNGGSNGYLAVYGWTTNPLVEYYIVENYGNWTPPGGQSVGTITSDNGTYNLYKMHRDDAPSIIGDHSSFDQYWSVRTSKRSSGTVTTANHFNAWKSRGWNMGTFDYQIMESEGYQSSGSANITVSEVNPTPTPTPTPRLTPTPTPGTAGDINRDGKIDSTDGALLQRYVLGTYTFSPISIGDLNNDGQVNSTDYALLKRKLLGLETT